jgi:peptidoglycan hydrolase CwlO-like protein
MNAKRWFAWLCLALMLVAEIFLFRSNHTRDAALADLRDAQHQLRETQTELDALKNSAAGAQVAEIASLHKQNDALMNKVNALQKNLDRLKSESQQTAQHLTTARTALELQQEHLQQLQAEQQRAALVANASACINNLRTIDAAKTQWAVDKNKAATDVPTAQDLLPYFKDGIFPVCPDGGTYAINSLNDPPTCTVTGHALPAQ